MTHGQRLDSVADITMGQAPEGASYNLDGEGTPLVAGAGDFGEVHPAVKKFTNAPGKICQSGDIILGIRATIGEKVLADRPYCLGRGVAGLRARPGLDDRYLWHWLTHATPILAAKAKGATFKQVNREDIGELRLNLPPLPEQRRIAQILDKADALRAQRHATLAQLNTLAQSIYRDMFGGAAAARHSWAQVQVGQLCEAIIDCPHSTPVYAHTRTEYPCVRSSDIQGGELSFLNTKYVEKTEYEKRIARGAPKVGDVIYCREGARFGNAARIATEMSLCLGQRMMLFRPQREIATTEYLWGFLGSSAAYRQASRMAGGSASPHVNIREIVTFMLPHAPIQRQREFARRVHAIDRQKAPIRASLAQLDALFSTLEYRAFRNDL